MATASSLPRCRSKHLHHNSIPTDGFFVHKGIISAAKTAVSCCQFPIYNINMPLIRMHQMTRNLKKKGQLCEELQYVFDQFRNTKSKSA
jgi:hypothetical protein